jgi:hypothetical protein
MPKRPDKIMIATVVIFILSFSNLTAGYLTDQLHDYIAARDADEFVRVLIVPTSDHESMSLKTSLAKKYLTRGQRHRTGIAQLKASAEISQAAIKDRLRDIEIAGQAKNTKSFWITNIIEAEITVSSLRKLAANNGIEKIELYPTIVSIPPVVSSRLSTATAGVENNLKIIKADSAWAIGYDGRGRIVCSFDTGVDGLHPALESNYRGNKGYPASQCWFSSVDSSDFPHAFNSAGFSKPHGTHTTGIMVGHADDAGDTVGVAPGADWIAAVAFDVPGASIFEAYQWAVDPDGNPNTISDIPDVINHSWGVVGIGCSDLFWDLIDNSEALGIVNIFSAGNEGPGEFTIRNPANRAADSITNFSVGALNATYDSIWIGPPPFASSQGPSDCDSVSVKPNVVAPGEQVRSSVPGGGYMYFSGTSGAAPHVSGAVAILRQKNPDATVDEIKMALLNSVMDMGDIGPDNTYGWGRIDIMEALRQIDSIVTPSLQISGFTYPQIFPDDTVELDLALKNVGTPIDSVQAVFANPESGLTIISGPIDFGFIDSNAAVTGSAMLRLAFDPTVESGRFYSLDMLITGGGDYLLPKRLNFFVGEMGERTYFHHDTGLVKFTISNYGAYGFHSGTYVSLGFEGYKLDRDINDLYESALLIGTDSLHVSDCAHNIGQEPDNDFAVTPGGSIKSFSPGSDADQETVAFFDDSYAERPLGLSIRQKSYGWASDPDNTFVILEYVITNTSKVSVNGVRVGLFFDWDINHYLLNHGTFLPDDNIGYMCWSMSGDSADFRGVRVLNPEGLTNHRVYFNPDDIYYSNFTDARKYLGLADNSSGTISSPGDLSHVTATGPFNLDVQESDTAVFAVIGGADWEAFMVSADRAERRYNDLPTDVDNGDGILLPDQFTLYQNYPNPFNPATTISFSIPQTGQVRIDVFDVLGRNLHTLLDSKLPAGEHAFNWDGISRGGDPVASGIYFYRVRYNDNSLTRKMVMMK